MKRIKEIRKLEYEERERKFKKKLKDIPKEDIYSQDRESIIL